MNLKNLRMQNNLSQQQLAKTLGIKQNTLSNYENGITQPDLNLIIKISDFFGCSIDYLLGHQTKNLIYSETLTPIQQRLVELIKKLNDEQGLFLIGYLSDMLKIPYDQVKPVKPW